MSIKLFCDICGEERTDNLLRKVILTSLPGENHGDYEADVCKNCTEKALSPLKQFRTTFHIEIEIPPKSKKAKK